MTILSQLERDLFSAAEERLRPDATAPHRRSGSLLSSFRARLGRAAASLALVLSVAVVVAVAVVAVAVLGHGRHPGPSATASGPSGGSPRAELIRTLGVLRRPQTKADLQGVERLGRWLKAVPKQEVGPNLKQWGYPELDRRLARVVNVPAWRAKVLIAPSQPSATSGHRPERVELGLWWTGTTFPWPRSLNLSGPTPTSVGALLVHGLAVDPVVPGLDEIHGVVRGPDVQDGVLLVPDGVASIKLGRFTADVTVGGLSTKALKAALAAIHGTAAVHDNIAAFRLPIAVYNGRPPHWSNPGPVPKYVFSGIPATAQDTWYDTRGHVLRRTTTEIGLTVRIPAHAAKH